jgi:3'-phosphoadenosine 5'-phosphosulfate sulfotransferase (PAPS reductase)/FAD synthetase
MMATANTKRNNNALVSDLYTTPAWAVLALIKRERFRGSILDAGCGKGHIAKVLESRCHDVKGIDLYDWGYGEAGIDYLACSEKASNVISNPPFTLLSEFISKSIEVADDKVAIFARVSALESIGRWESIYKTKPPTKVYLFVNRVKCNKGGHDDGQSSSVFYCWMVWDLKVETNVTQLEWIDDKPTKNEKPKLDPKAPAVHVSDVRTLLDETISMYRSCFPSTEDYKHLISTSGGKDSGCAYIIGNIATEGKTEAFFCDTDNENPETLEYINNLHIDVGNNAPKVTHVKACFSEAKFEARRKYILENWQKPHRIIQGQLQGQVIPPMKTWQIENAIKATQRSGNAMLDLFLLHGGIPNRMGRYCTEELKIDVMLNQVLLPTLAEYDGEVINWSGVRAQESEQRSTYKWIGEDPRGDGFLFTFLPIHKWLVQDVFALHKYFNVKPNPLYLKGAKRVGCWPCILSNKSEIRQVATETPEAISRLADWEERVLPTSRFAVWKQESNPKYSLSFLGHRKNTIGNVHDVVKWSMTDRKGDEIEYSGAEMNCKIGNHNFCE